MQFGLISSHGCFDADWIYTVPWHYGEEAVAVTRFFTKMKLRLMPYLQNQSVKTAASGVPMMRPMVLDFPEDIATHELDRQYMLGDGLLIAPIFNQTGQVQ